MHSPFFLHQRVQKTLNYNYTKFDTPNFITDKVTSISKRDGCLASPPTFLRVKGGCQSGRKVVTHDSKSDLPLVTSED